MVLIFMLTDLYLQCIGNTKIILLITEYLFYYCIGSAWPNDPYVVAFSHLFLQQTILKYTSLLK